MVKPILLPTPRKMIWAETYRRLAADPDIHSQTQRKNKELTEEIAQKARKRIDPRPGEVVLDIGCGDGRLIDALADNAGLAVGTAATPEEVARLVATYAGRPIKFMTLLIDEASLDYLKCEVVLACAVLNHLGSKKRVRAALNNIASMMLPNGRLYIGDFSEEPVEPKLHSSTLRAIHFVWRTSGFFAALGFGIHLWKRRHRAGRYEVPRLPRFVSSPEDFIKLASECGFDHISHWRFIRNEEDGATRPRNDFLFRLRA